MKKYEIDKEQRKATFIYVNKDQIIRYTMYMNDDDSSLGQIKTDQLIREYEMETGEGIIVSVKEYEKEESDQNRYVAEFEYKDAQYQIMGSIEKEEFEKIVENLIFL